MMRRHFWYFLPCLTLLPLLAYGQMQEEPPERVEVSELLRAPGMYDGKTVIVRGRLLHGEMLGSGREIYRLRGEDSLREVRVGEAAFGMGDIRYLAGQEVIITGIFWDLGSQCTKTPQGVQCFDQRLRRFAAVTEDFEREDYRYFIGVQAADLVDDEPLPKEEESEEPEDPPDLDITPGAPVDLRELVTNPSPYLGKRVTVVGKFRGNNLYGDLSIRTKKTPRDFIIKVADTAVWITGRRPKGDGFELNPRMRRDTGKWLEVIGVPWMGDDMVYVRAEKMTIVPKPDDPSLEPVDVGEEEEEKELGPPPEVAFALPLDGERGIPLDTEFRVQFSNDMNEASFNRNIDLLYGDDDGAGNPFPDMQIRYEAADRILVVTPGRKLEPQKQIQLILYKGITDEDGQPLVAIPTELDLPDVAVILTYFTAPQ